MRTLTALLLATWTLSGQAPPLITTIAGTDYVFPAHGGPANTAPLGRVTGVAVDPQGNVLLSDNENLLIARVDSRGILSVVGGNGFHEISGDGGPARSAAIRFPSNVTTDAAGNIFFVDDNVVRRISREGIITTFAGGGTSLADNISATAASLSAPSGIAAASNGDVYLADAERQRVFVVSGGILRTIAGGGSNVADGAPALSSVVRFPRGLALDRGGTNLFLCEDGEDQSGRVRRISLAQGTIHAVAGGGSLEADDSPALLFLLFRPTGLAFDAAGDLYIADEAMDAVFRVSAGRIRRFAGSNSDRSSGDGGPATRAGLNTPTAVAVDAAGNVYIAEVDGLRVRRVDRNGIITTFAGSGLFRLSGDGGPARSATLNHPDRLAIDAAGNIYFNDGSNSRVRRISPAGIVTTFAGGGTLDADNIRATDARLDLAFGLTVDRNGNVLVAQIDRIRSISPAGIITTIAGGGDNLGENVPARDAVVEFSAALAFDTAGNLYFAEYTNHRVRRLGLDGRITTFAGTGEQGFSGDAGPATRARLDSPRGLAVDAAGNVYIGEVGSGRVRRVGIDGIISTFAGGGSSRDENIPANQASLDSIESLAFDSAGNLYLADSGASLVRRVTPGRVISTFAGNGLFDFSGDGGPAIAAAANQPAGVAIDAAGNVLIADSGNHRIRKVLLTQTPTLQAAPLSLSFSAQSGGAAPAEQVVTLISDVPLPYTVSVTTVPGGNWLAVAPLSGSLPAALRVSVNPANLAAGDYAGTITVSVPGAAPPAITIRVAAAITAPIAAELVVEPAQLEFAFLPGDRPALQQLRISNRGGGSISASLRTTGAGLSVSPSTVTATAALPAAATVTADPSGLTPGTYRGNVIVTSRASALPITVPITIVVGNVRGGSLLLSQTGLSFLAVAASPGIAPAQRVAVLNSGRGTLSFTASASVLGDLPAWLSVTPSAGEAVADSLQIAFLDVEVNPTGLSPGTYFGLIRVEAADADNSPQFLSVSLSILAAGSRPPPIVRPSGIVFVGEERTSPGSQDLFISNLTEAPVSFISGRTPEPPNALFSALPPQGTVRPDTPFRIQVQPSYTNLTRGIRPATLTLDFSDGSFQTVRVLLVVVPRATAPTALRAAHSSCVPASLQSEFTLVPKGFTAVTGLPFPIEARVVDDCGHSFAAGSVTASFSNGDPPVPLVHVQDGRWSGTYTPKIATIAPLLIKLNSVAASGDLRGEATIDGSARSGSGAPVVGNGGILNAGVAAPFAPLSPGAIFEIYGSALADRLIAGTQQPLATVLGSTEVFLQGRRLPLLFVSDGQVNAIVPYGTSINTRLPLVVRRGGSSTSVETVTLAPAQPSILAANPASQQPHVYSAQNELIGTARPARRGETLIAYSVGLGPVNVAVADGAAAPSSPLAFTSNAVSATIGGRSAQVQFAGLVPGFAGLYQVNLVVAEDTPASAASPVVLTVSGQSSVAVTIPVE